jgi:dolichol-phosphate mannosyltransferase
MNSSPRVAVIIPTYNERKSIAELVERIMALAIPNLEIIIVDDASPDGTGAIANELAQKYPLQVLHRTSKAGLGKAYVHTFMNIIARPPELRPDYIIQMDADFSHNPTDIPRSLERIGSCDVVLGSRYIRGGGIENWNRMRHMISKFGNIYASIILGVPFHDLTSGFKCFRYTVLEKLDLSEVSSVGYNFQIEITYLAHKKGFVVCEIPIIFTERKFGNSKFNVWIIIESFIKVLFLRFRK